MKDHTTQALRLTVIALAVASSALTSCASNEELQQRLDERNERYYKLSERREMRTDARQARTDAWFDRVMH